MIVDGVWLSMKYEEDSPFKPFIYERVGGKLYRRKFLDYDNRELIVDE